MPKVVITGISRGIGQATAEKFLEEGWQVFGSSTSGQALTKGPNFKIYQLDLANPKSIDQFVKAVVKDAGKIDVLINNAGVHLDNTNQEVEIDILRQTLEVNLIGLIDLTQKLTPIIKAGGQIINISSGAGSISDLTYSYAPAYQISKGSLNMATRVLASTLRDRGIIVSAVDPGWVKTDMGGSSAPRDPQQPAEEIYKLATSKIDSGFFWYQNKRRNW